MVEEARQQGPLLLLDAGNALFKAVGVDDEAARARAELIADTMGRLGTLAMAVGSRDLVAGSAYLKGLAQKAQLKLLSVNLQGPDGKLLFAPSLVTTVGAVRVGLIGASPVGPGLGQERTVGAPVVPAVLAEAKRLRPKVDVVVVLAAIPYGDALQLAQESKGEVELLLQSNEARGAGMAQKVGEAFVVPAGERGRAVGRLELALSGKGSLVDLAELDRSKQSSALLQSQVEEVQRRLAAATDPSVKKGLQETMASFQQRKRELDRALAQGTPGKGRTLRLDWRTLGPEVKEDAALKQRVEKLEPPGAAGH